MLGQEGLGESGSGILPLQEYWGGRGVKDGAGTTVKGSVICYACIN